MEADAHKQTLAHLAAAPFDRSRWPDAIAGLAAAAGGHAGQLLGVSPSRGFVFDFSSGLSEDVLREFEAWGADPKVMPRARIISAPVLATVADYDLLDEAARGRSNFYNEFLKRVDASFCCMARVDQIADLSFVAVSLRSESAGHVDDEQREAFAALLPHVSAAIRIQLRLEDEAALVATRLMDAVSIAAFVCAPSGRVMSMSRAAEAVLTQGALLKLTGGVLRSTDPASNAALDQAIRRASRNDDEVGMVRSSRIHLRNLADRRFVAADVAPLPQDLNSFSRGAVLIALKLDLTPSSPAATLQRLYGLSGAEAEVAVALSRGANLAEISEARRVKVSTLRTQVARILAKTETERQAELTALIAGLT